VLGRELTNQVDSYKEPHSVQDWILARIASGMLTQANALDHGAPGRF
jgi:hypothetical protein